MKKLAIALYAALAVTVWLVFLPPDTGTDNHASPVAEHASRPQSNASPQSKTAHIASSAQGNPGQGRNETDPAPLAEVTRPSVNDLMTTAPAPARTAAGTGSKPPAIVSVAQRREPAPQIATGTVDRNAAAEASASGRSNTVESTAGFAFLPAATYPSTMTASDTSATTKTVTDTRSQTQPDNNRETLQTADTDTIATNTDTTSTTDKTSVTDNTGAVGDGSAFLPQGDTTGLTQPQQNTQHFKCPTSCYLKCTAYEINMLIQEGCPVPNQ